MAHIPCRGVCVCVCPRWKPKGTYRIPILAPCGNSSWHTGERSGSVQSCIWKSQRASECAVLRLGVRRRLRMTCAEVWTSAGEPARGNQRRGWRPKAFGKESSSAFRPGEVCLWFIWFYFNRCSSLSLMLPSVCGVPKPSIRSRWERPSCPKARLAPAEWRPGPPGRN